MTNLTNKTVAAIKPRDDEFFVWDAKLPGFGLRVKPSGAKSFLIQYRNRSGRTRRYSLGKVGVVAPEQARKIAKRELARIADGADPSAERKEARQAESMAELAEQYLKEYAEEHKAPQSVRTDCANIENHVLPLMGAMKIRDINRADVERVHRAIKNGKTARELPARSRGRRTIKGGPGIANRVARLLSKMFACAEEWGLREGNPARGIRMYKEAPRHRYLDADEIARLVAALDDAERAQTESPFAIAGFRFLLYTGLRRGEAFCLRWRDVDLRKGVVRLQNTKTRKGRTVQLNTAAQEVLTGLSEGAPDHIVFRGAARPDGPLSPGRPWQRIRERAKFGKIEIGGIMETVRIHTLRHTVGTHGAAAGLTEFQLMQLLGHRTAATTRRYVQEIEEATRRDAEKVGSAISAMGRGESAEVIEISKQKG